MTTPEYKFTKDQHPDAIAERILDYCYSNSKERGYEDVHKKAVGYLEAWLKDCLQTQYEELKRINAPLEDEPF